jgi:two-component system response regulator FixJ
MVYRHLKYVVLFGKQPMTLARIAKQLHVRLRCFEREDECLHYLSKCCCDLLVIDLEKSATEALDVLTKVRGMCPWLARLVLISAGGIASAVEVMKMGATECLEKPLSQERLSSVIQRELSRLESSDSKSHAVLTPSELRVLGMVLAGKTSKEISSSLSRSRRTIDAHRSRIMHKLGTSNLLELAKWAMSRGFYSPQSGGSAHTEV